MIRMDFLFAKGERAQVTIDYIAGMSIFLVTVAFIFQFMYGLFTPFQSYSEEVTLAADRAGTILVDRLLIEEKTGMVSVIDQGKLSSFITRLNASNVTLYKNTLDELGLNNTESVLFDMNLSVTKLDGTVINQSGPEIPKKTDTGQTKRLVLIVNSSTGYNENAIIAVRVW